MFIRHFSPFAKVFKIVLLSLSPFVCTDDICNYSASCRISLRRIQLQGWTGDSVNCLFICQVAAANLHLERINPKGYIWHRETLLTENKMLRWMWKSNVGVDVKTSDSLCRRNKGRMRWSAHSSQILLSSLRCHRRKFTAALFLKHHSGQRRREYTTSSPWQHCGELVNQAGRGLHKDTGAQFSIKTHMHICKPYPYILFFFILVLKK